MEHKEKLVRKLRLISVKSVMAILNKGVQNKLSACLSKYPKAW